MTDPTLDSDPAMLTTDEIRTLFGMAKKEISVANASAKDAYHTSGIALVGMLMLVVAFVVVCD